METVVDGSVAAQRTHEIGIRIALGANLTDVHRLILSEGIATVPTCAILVAVEIFACLLPACRAAKIEPMPALRDE